MKRLQKITKKAWVTMPLVVVMVAMIIMVPGLQSHAGGYNAQQAAAYAEQWSGSNRNPDYRNYSGADCMNYVSQCLRAGGLETGSDWQPYTASWVGCVSFVNAMRARGYQVIENPSADQIYPGNPVLFQWKGSSYEWSHATICVGYDGNGTPIVNGHTTDRVHVKWNYGASSARRMCTVLINDGKAPTTEAPATEAPATEAPATEAPATEAPATEAPVIEEPTTEAPVTEEPTEEATTESTEEATTEPTEEAATESTEEAATEPTEEVATEPTEEVATEPTESTVIAGNTDINVAIDNSTNNTFITFINNILGIEETQAEESDTQAEITTEAAYNTAGGSDNTDWCREEAQRRYDAGLQEGYEPVTVVEEQQETDTVQTEKQKDEVQTTDSADTDTTDAEDSADTDITDAEDSADTKDTKNTVDSTDTEDSAEIENGIRLVTNVDENGRLKNLYLQIVLPVNGEKQVYMIQLI